MDSIYLAIGIAAVGLLIRPIAARLRLDDVA